MKPINIVDVIDHRNAYGTQRMLVVDRMPKPIFERRGSFLIGHDAGLFQFFRYEAPGPNCKAFGGWKFDIPLSDGSVIKASGQWWDPGTPADFRELVYPLGVNTIEGLCKCYVFFGGYCIDRDLVDDWLKNRKASNNYNRYDPRHEDHGKRTIKSQWDDSAQQSAGLLRRIRKSAC